MAALYDRTKVTDTLARSQRDQGKTDAVPPPPALNVPNHHKLGLTKDLRCPVCDSSFNGKDVRAFRFKCCGAGACRACVLKSITRFPNSDSCNDGSSLPIVANYLPCIRCGEPRPTPFVVFLGQEIPFENKIYRFTFASGDRPLLKYKSDIISVKNQGKVVNPEQFDSRGHGLLIHPFHPAAGGNGSLLDQERNRAKRLGFERPRTPSPTLELVFSPSYIFTSDDKINITPTSFDYALSNIRLSEDSLSAPPSSQVEVSSDGYLSDSELPDFDPPPYSFYSRPPITLPSGDAFHYTHDSTLSVIEVLTPFPSPLPYDSQQPSTSQEVVTVPSTRPGMITIPATHPILPVVSVLPSVANHPTVLAEDSDVRPNELDAPIISPVIVRPNELDAPVVTEVRSHPTPQLVPAGSWYDRLSTAFVRHDLEPLTSLTIPGINGSQVPKNPMVKKYTGKEFLADDYEPACQMFNIYVNPVAKTWLARLWSGILRWLWRFIDLFLSYVCFFIPIHWRLAKIGSHINPRYGMANGRYGGLIYRINFFSEPDCVMPKFTNFYTTLVDTKMVSFLVTEYIGYKNDPDLPRFMVAKLLHLVPNLEIQFASDCAAAAYQTILFTQIRFAEATINVPKDNNVEKKLF
jgi:hypothetical protein